MEGDGDPVELLCQYEFLKAKAGWKAHVPSNRRKSLAAVQEGDGKPKPKRGKKRKKTSDAKKTSDEESQSSTSESSSSESSSSENDSA